MHQPTNRTSRWIALGTLGLTLLVLVFAAAEALARRSWTQRYDALLQDRQAAHPFLRVDPERHLLLPQPGAPIARNPGREPNELEPAPPQQQIERVNPSGFRGPDVEVPKPAGVLRILALGDGVTWGPAVEPQSYPRVLERALRGRLNGSRVEVVNAGVPGHGYEQVLKRVDGLIALEPDVVTLYLGWNGAIDDADPRRFEGLFRALALYRLVSAGERATRAEPVDEPDDPFLERLRGHRFGYDMLDLSILVRTIHEELDDVEIVLVTLAGLFDERLPPPPVDGQSPVASTPNLRAWAVLTRAYNEQLRDFDARRPEVELIDFEAYALDRFRPREEYFTSVAQLSPAGHRELGRFLADELIRRDLVPPAE